MIASAGSIPFCRVQPVLLGLGPQVVDVVEHHLVELADPRVEVAGNRDVEDQGQPVPPRALNADVLLERDDRLVGGRRADDQVGLDQRLVEPLERHGPAAPARRGRFRALGVAVGHQDLARVQPLQVLQGQLAHLARADHQHGLVGERVEDPLGDVDRHAGDRELALVHPGPLADQLADPQRRLEHRVEDRADRLALDGRA